MYHERSSPSTSSPREILVNFGGVLFNPSDASHLSKPLHDEGSGQSPTIDGMRLTVHRTLQLLQSAEVEAVQLRAKWEDAEYRANVSQKQLEILQNALCRYESLLATVSNCYTKCEALKGASIALRRAMEGLRPLPAIPKTTPSQHTPSSSSSLESSNALTNSNTDATTSCSSKMAPSMHLLQENMELRIRLRTVEYEKSQLQKALAVNQSNDSPTLHLWSACMENGQPPAPSPLNGPLTRTSQASSPGAAVATSFSPLSWPLHYLQTPDPLAHPYCVPEGNPADIASTGLCPLPATGDGYGSPSMVDISGSGPSPGNPHQLTLLDTAVQTDAADPNQDAKCYPTGSIPHQIDVQVSVASTASVPPDVHLHYLEQMKAWAMEIIKVEMSELEERLIVTEEEKAALMSIFLMFQRQVSGGSSSSSTDIKLQQHTDALDEATHSANLTPTFSDVPDPSQNESPPLGTDTSPTSNEMKTSLEAQTKETLRLKSSLVAAELEVVMLQQELAAHKVLAAACHCEDASWGQQTTAASQGCLSVQPAEGVQTPEPLSSGPQVSKTCKTSLGEDILDNTSMHAAAEMASHCTPSLISSVGDANHGAQLTCQNETCKQQQQQQQGQGDVSLVHDEPQSHEKILSSTGTWVLPGGICLTVSPPDECPDLNLIGGDISIERPSLYPDGHKRRLSSPPWEGDGSPTGSETPVRHAAQELGNDLNHLGTNQYGGASPLPLRQALMEKESECQAMKAALEEIEYSMQTMQDQQCRVVDLLLRHRRRSTGDAAVALLSWEHCEQEIRSIMCRNEILETEVQQLMNVSNADSSPCRGNGQEDKQFNALSKSMELASAVLDNRVALPLEMGLQYSPEGGYHILAMLRQLMIDKQMLQQQVERAEQKIHLYNEQLRSMKEELRQVRTSRDTLQNDLMYLRIEKDILAQRLKVTADRAQEEKQIQVSTLETQASLLQRDRDLQSHLNAQLQKQLLEFRVRRQVLDGMQQATTGNYKDEIQVMEVGAIAST